MSGRLRFQEEEIHTNHGGESEDDRHQPLQRRDTPHPKHSNDNKNKTKKASSYELFDLTGGDDDADDGDNTKDVQVASNKKHSGTHNNSNSNQTVKKTVVVIDDDDDSSSGGVGGRTLEINHNSASSQSQSQTSSAVVTGSDNNNDNETQKKNKKKRNKKNKKKKAEEAAAAAASAAAATVGTTASDSEDSDIIELPVTAPTGKGNHQPPSLPTNHMNNNNHNTTNKQTKKQKKHSSMEDDEDDTDDNEVDIGTSTLVENLVELVDVNGKNTNIHLLHHSQSSAHSLANGGKGESDVQQGEGSSRKDEAMTVSTSNWLNKFLSTKRAHIEDYPVEEYGPSNDTFIQLFYDDFKKDTEVKVDSDNEEEEESSHTDDSQFNIFEAMKDKSYQEDDAEDMGDMDTTATIHFYNLPYKIDEDDMRDFVSSCKLKVKSVVIGTAEKKKGMPLGSASVTFIVPNEGDGITTVDELVDLFNGQPCGGRPVRAQKPSHLDLKRRISFGPGKHGDSSGMRYFVTDISCKCNSCGQVGHRQQECFNDPLPIPCHFCAGCDHDAGECPNIICYRCGKFGHHSRDCYSGNRPRPIVCFQCGSLQHDLLKCPEIVSIQEKPSRYDSKVEDSFVKCMNCSQTGHIMCHRMPWDRHMDSKKRQRKTEPSPVYCPNCGQSGHHIDFPPHPDDDDYYDPSKYCKAPKCEAYFRYPKLRDIENILDYNHDIQYREMVKNPNDLNLFPSLSIPAPPRGYKQFQRYNSGNGGGGGGGGYGGRDDRGRGYGGGGGRRVDYDDYDMDYDRNFDRDSYGGYGRGGGGRGGYNNQNQNRYDNRDRERDYDRRGGGRDYNAGGGGGSNKVSNYFSNNNNNSSSNNNRPLITGVTGGNSSGGGGGGNKKRTFNAYDGDDRDDDRDYHRGKRSKPAEDTNQGKSQSFNRNNTNNSNNNANTSSYQTTKEWQDKFESRKKRFGDA